MSTVCDTCSKTYQSGVHPDMFTGKKECLECLTKARIAMMLAVFPRGDMEADEAAWEKLTASEQKFLLSVRLQFQRKGTLSYMQYQTLERMNEKQKCGTSMLNEQQIFVIENIAWGLRHAYQAQTGDQGTDLRRLQDEIHRALLVLETEERDLWMQQVRVLRHLELVSNLHQQLYNSAKVVQSENRRDSQ